jgi:cytochrome c oxidase subunit II
MTAPSRARAYVTAFCAFAMSGCARNLPMNTIAPKSDLAQWIYSLYFDVTAWDALILLIVVTALFLALFVFSTRVGEAAPPSSVASDIGLEVAWTVGPALIILFISIPTIRMIFRSQPAIAPKGALHVTVVAHQWWWEFDYPGLGITTANELHIPVDRPIRLSLESADVIHSFWVPELGGKRDVVPGQVNELTFVARVPGVYLGQCAEFCGLSHANMRFKVFVNKPEQFARWIADERTVPPLPTGNTPASRGETIFASSPCTTCHTIRGISKGRRAPDLTHFGSRTTLAARVLDNTPQNVEKWIEDPKAIKPGAEMPALGVRGREVADLTAYLESLK